MTVKSDLNEHLCLNTKFPAVTEVKLQDKNSAALLRAGIKPKIALKKSSAHLPLLLPSYLPTAFKEMLTAPQGKDNLKLTQSKVTKHCLESSDVFEKKSQISIVIAGSC